MGTRTSSHPILLIRLTYYYVVLDVEFIVEVYDVYLKPTFFLLVLALLFFLPASRHVLIFLQVQLGLLLTA